MRGSEPGPYGQPLVTSGTLAYDNPFRFSTKYADDETGLAYYGYRYYGPGVGRWISRDPNWERGGVNICAFVFNNAMYWVDPLGRKPAWDPCGCDEADIHRLGAKMASQAQQLTQASMDDYLWNGLEMGREFCGRICCNRQTKEVSFTGPVHGDFDPQTRQLSCPRENTPPCPDGTEEVAFYHSHPGDSHFSPGDTGFTSGYGSPLYLVGADGQPQVLIPQQPTTADLHDLVPSIAPGSGTVDIPVPCVPYNVNDDGSLQPH